MMKENDPFIDIEKLFEKKDTHFLENARKNSIGVELIERITTTLNVDIKVVKNAIVGLIATTLVIANGTKLISSQMNKTLQMFNVSQEIGSILYDDNRSVSIVSQNTHRNGENSYYSQDAIARDLLRLDDNLFDYAFCAVCNDMGKNINNKVGIGGKSNIDSVIYFLKLYSSVDGGFTNDYVRQCFEGVDTLDDYLLKNNYVDKAGNPSYAVFKSYCDENSQVIIDLIQSQVSKGVNRAWILKV